MEHFKDAGGWKASRKTIGLLLKKNESKIVPVLNIHVSMKMGWSWLSAGIFHALLSSALDGDGRSVSHLGRFVP
jgi:hypothetical protein